MAIGFRDLAYQAIQREFGSRGGETDLTIVCDGYLKNVALFNPGFDKCLLGKPDGDTVAPSGEFGLHDSPRIGVAYIQM